MWVRGVHGESMWESHLHVGKPVGSGSVVMNAATHRGAHRGLGGVTHHELTIGLCYTIAFAALGLHGVKGRGMGTHFLTDQTQGSIGLGGDQIRSVYSKWSPRSGCRTPICHLGDESMVGDLARPRYQCASHKGYYVDLCWKLPVSNAILRIESELRAYAQVISGVFKAACRCDPYPRPFGVTFLPQGGSEVEK